MDPEKSEEQVEPNSSKTTDGNAPKIEKEAAEGRLIVEDQREEEEAESLKDIQRQALEQLTDQDRLVLYEKGIKFKRKGNSQHALHCFLGCLRGLEEGNKFPVLPQCLHNIAELYSAEEDYGPAIQFAQAEKLYYETALVTVGTDLTKESDELTPEDVTADQPNEHGSHPAQPVSTSENSASNSEVHKAEEYEKLAHMCLKQKNTQLALEYCAKAVKVRQAHFGERHPVTLRTLDLFTVIYAEMGKLQYSAALEKFSAIQKQEEKDNNCGGDKLSSETPDENISQIPSSSGDDTCKQQENLEEVGSLEEQNSEETGEGTTSSQGTIEVSSGCALLLYFLFTVLVCIGTTTSICYYTQLDAYTSYKYILTRLRFHYYYYFNQGTSNGQQYF